MTPPIHNSQFTIHNSQFQNPNLLYSHLFVQSLVDSGLTAVCISPGSRSTPLTLAFAAQKGIEIYRHLDERSAGFFALGLAVATERPVALVCTSGTAVANYFPAIIEAQMSQVPLLILTGDRPHELRHSGANQTIDQVKIFGDQVLWAVDMPIPQADAPEVVLRSVQTTAARAYATANGAAANGRRQGPVHVNFPFRKPLEPEVGSGEWGVRNAALPTPKSEIRNPKSEIILSRSQQEALTAVINHHERGLIVCGPRCPGGNFPQAVAGLSQISGWPILADPLSGVRFGLHSSGTVISGGYETYMQGRLDWPEPEVILRFGAVPTSKWLNAYLERSQPAHRIHIRASGVWADDAHQTSWFVAADEEQACYQMAQGLVPRLSSGWLDRVHGVETAVWQAVEGLSTDFTDFTDFWVVMDTVELMPPNGRLFVGNSLPIRHVDQFARPSTKPLHVYANRGASGIDGNVSTALGYGAAGRSPLVALLGDITFYHDMNGLLAIANRQSSMSLRDGFAPVNRQSPMPPTTFVILNNNGGGIFRRLPIAEFEPEFTDLFLTPHNLDFEHAARLYGLDFIRTANRAAFRQALRESMYNPTPRLIEVPTDGRYDDQRRREINKIVNKVFSGGL
ncbi:MAG: 2-succinyl-5-enolpyruvyl-6-hydroxy-3-cyclohexene-1-carboxylic-acid synthase [Chloroflexi bacterium]|nr:2-succinyl-5-enolpyruvyl-6-hydroxy-3-cyclohexene-1-carboxylic-acid synthase [Chloroflexota bacterium]